MKSFLLIILIMLVSCSTPKSTPQSSALNIEELNPDKETHLTTQNLVLFTKIYDLVPITYFKTVQIKNGAIPRHKPTILLNTRFSREPHKILSSFIHEQFHWWLIQNPKASEAAIRSLKNTFPEANDHIHLIICFLEYKAMTHYAGEKIANKTLNDFINKDKIYPWFNNQVKTNGVFLEKLIRSHHLIPKFLN